jgi:hypothetical protein
VRREKTRSHSDLDMWNRLAPYVLRLFGRHGPSPGKRRRKRKKETNDRYAEKYDGDYIVGLFIRVYMEGKKMDRPALSSEERDSSLSSIIQASAGLSEIEPITAREILNRNRKRSHPTHITALKSSSTKLKPFIVADTETILIDNVHKPYAAGLLMVRPGEEINDLMIYTYFSENYSIILDSFEDRSTKVLYDLVLRISTIVRREQSSLTIYFHNLSRFDGILVFRMYMFLRLG